MNRRHALRTIGISWLAALTLGLAGCTSTTKHEEKRGLPIVQGLTNSTATQISVVAAREPRLEFYYGEVELTKLSSTTVTSNTNQPTDLIVHHLQIENLKPHTDYTLEVREAGGSVVDRRQFSALDVSPRPARVIAASCLYDLFLIDSRGMWKALIGEKPDLLLLIGDNVYAEITNGRFKSPLDEAALWTRYSETFQTLDFYKTAKLIPTLVTWDDHDYGMKDGNLENPHKHAAKKVLEAFFSQYPSPAFPEFASGPGVSSKFDAFGYRFMLLDNRSFRTPKDFPAGTETHFGATQEKWILQNVSDTKLPVWLISGDQWFGGYHKFESYEGRHPSSFKKFLSSLKNTSSTIMFMSGDRHLSEINRIDPETLGYETYEFTSSSLHSKAHPANWDTIPNRRQVRGIDMHHAFTLFELTPMLSDRTVRLKGATIGNGSKVLYSFDFEIKRPRLRKPRR